RDAPGNAIRHPDRAVRQHRGAGDVAPGSDHPSAVWTVDLRRAAKEIGGQPAAEKMKVSVIMPVYNEFRTFPQVLERVRNAALPPGCTMEIVVVDDGSTDGSTQMIAE